MDAITTNDGDRKESMETIEPDSPEDWTFSTDLWVGEIDTPFLGPIPLDTVQEDGSVSVEVKSLCRSRVPLFVELEHDDPEMSAGLTANLTADQADALADRLRRQAAALREGDE